MPPRVSIGLDLIGRRWPRRLSGARAGLVVHPASVNRNLIHASSLLMKSAHFRLAVFFGPQHGIGGETQDNMIEWEGFTDKITGLPVYSLYGRTRKPSKEMLRDIDVMVVDLQDVGARYYTFIWTMALIMEACSETGKSVVILDRPNPISGRHVEGPLLEPAYRSFVGLHRLPARHGMTIGEIALYVKDQNYPALDLQVIPMQGWKRSMWHDMTGLAWVMPSPNMPTLDSATVYPGMCLLEGTDLSEGRGTTRPFEIFGAPFIDPHVLSRKMKEYRLPGVVFRPLYFQPTFQKHAGTLCGGCQIHVTDRQAFRPFQLGVSILKAVHELYPREFKWKNPPYEYEEQLMPIDILSGSDRLRKDIVSGVSLKKMTQRWLEESELFDKAVRRSYLLYP
ncbi:MAG: DUF1343 domain-containing protein [Nitrospiraceae bacterium]|nr:DUF1343 domain-containing protein [Nitrospiraceae bacterium]